MTQAKLLSRARIQSLPSIIWVLIIGNFFVRGSYYMVWPFLSVILYKKYGLSASDVGLVLFSATAISSLVGIYAGNLSDRFGRNPVMYGASILGIIAFTLMAFVETLVPFIISIFIATLPRTLWDAPSKALVADALPDSKDRELAFQLLYFMVNLGAAIGPLFGVWAGLTGEQSSFSLTAIAYLGLIVALYVVLKSSAAQPHEQHKTGHGFRQTLKLLAADQVFLMLILANTVILFIYAHSDSSLIQYLTRANTPDLVELISAMIVLNATVIISLQFVLLKWMENIEVTQRIYIGIGLLTVAQLYYALNPVDQYYGWLIATFLLSVGEAILFPNMNIQLDQLAPKDLRGSYFGAANLYTLGIAFAPLLGGLVLDYGSGPMLFLINSALCIVTYLMYLTRHRLKRPEFAQTAEAES